MWTQVGPRNHVLDRGPDPHTWRDNFEGKWACRGHAQACLTVDVLKASRQGAEPVQCGCRLACTRWGAHWRHLANAVEPSVCGGSAALCHITLTTCSQLLQVDPAVVERTFLRAECPFCRPANFALSSKGNFAELNTVSKSRCCFLLLHGMQRHVVCCFLSVMPSAKFMTLDSRYLAGRLSEGYEIRHVVSLGLAVHQCWNWWILAQE